MTYPLTKRFRRRLPIYLNTTSKKSKALVIRFDLRYPGEDSQTFINSKAIDPDIPLIGNGDISRFSAKFNQKYERKGLSPAYIWVREQGGSSGYPHYHFAVVLDGQKTRSPHQVFQDAEVLWQSTIGTTQEGLVEHCMRSKKGVPHKNGSMLVRSASDFEAKFDEVHHQLSYLSKTSQKGAPKDGLRDFGMSRSKMR